MNRTILELDLVGYNSIASTLEESLGSSAVSTLNADIQGFIDQALKTVGLSRSTSVALTTGDGAILLLERAADAHHFALAVHENTRTHNQDKLEATAKRFFRIGAATGDITVQPRGDGAFDIAGVTIARAVRLEKAAQPGELIVDVATFGFLPRVLSISYGDEVTIDGKRDERYAAHRCLMNSEAPKVVRQKAKPSTVPTGDRRSILSLFAKLHPTNVSRLIFLLEIPIIEQPREGISVSEAERQILSYASDTLDGLGRLESELNYLVERQ